MIKNFKSLMITNRDINLNHKHHLHTKDKLAIKGITNISSLIIKLKCQTVKLFEIVKKVVVMRKSILLLKRF